MKTEIRDHTIVITPENAEFDTFLHKLSERYQSLEKYNIVVDLLPFGDLPTDKVKMLMPIAKELNNSGKSFVVVSKTDFNKISSKLTVVPTLSEAYDIIEMEEIERDLGF